MEDCPALNTRKNLAIRTFDKSKHGDAEVSVKNSNLTSINRNPLSPTLSDNLVETKINKIKRKARRLSASEKKPVQHNALPHGLKIKAKKKVTPLNTRSRWKSTSSIEALGRCDRTFLNEISSPKANSSEKITMAQVSEVYGQVQAVLNDPDYQHDDVTQPAPLTSSGEDKEVIYEATKQQHEIDQEKQTIGNQKGSKQALSSFEDPPLQTQKESEDKEKEEAEEEPNLDDMSNIDMMKLLMKTMVAHKEEIKKEFKTEFQRHDTKLQTVEHQQKQQDDKITNLYEEIKVEKEKSQQLESMVKCLQDQVKTLINFTVCHDNKIEEFERQKCEETLKSMNSNIIIKGLKESENEVCLEVVNTFLKEVVKIDTQINIITAYRIGKGNNRSMLVKLKNPSEKGKIYKKTSNLKGITNFANKPYKIFDQLPAKEAAERQRSQDIMWQNWRKVNTADHLDLQYKKGKLLINNTPYKKLIKPPQPRMYSKRQLQNK